MKTMTRTLLMLAALMLCGCSGDNNEVMAQTRQEKLQITIGGETRQATLVDNAATQELVARLQQSPVTLSLDTNGSFEIWGPLGFSLPTSNQQITAQPGDIIIAVGGLESGASISGGTCKSASSWTASSWHALYNGSDLALAFKTPASSSSGGNQGGPGGGPGGNQGGSSQQLVVYTTSTPSLKSGVTVSGGTEYFGGMANIGCTVSGGSTVTLSTYSGGNSGPGGH